MLTRLHLPVLLGLLCGTSAFCQATDLYVAPDGKDVWTGTRADPAEGDGPFASLTRARDAIRTMKAADGLPAGGVTVWIRSGRYTMEEGLHLTAEDSGSAESAVTYRSFEDDTVRLVGGRTLAADAFAPIIDPATRARLNPAAAEHIVHADLTALGLTDVGKMAEAFHGAPSLSELFINGKRMELACWPNEGWAEVEKIVRRGSVPRQGDTSGEPGIIQYAEERPSAWDVSGGVWLHGYWCFDWYDEVLRVAEIDPDTRQITFARPHHYGIRQGNSPPRRWRALNVLEELDAPGEYVIDTQTNTLYLYPPEPLEKATIVLSTTETPVIQLEDCSYVTLRGLTVEACRGTGIEVMRGDHNQILACTVRNTGEVGIRVHGVKHRVAACDVHDTGTLGVYVSGGDRRNLAPGRCVVHNNHIWRFSRRQRTYASGIQVNGVGHTLSHNLLHDAPHQAIGLGGNDHLIEYNVIHHVCMETDDCGAFYKGRNPSARGNRIRYNFWHHVGSPRGHGNNAVYFDDGDGGDVVFGNVFFRCGEPAQGNMGAVFSHGGHDLLIENNVFIECKRAVGASPWSDAHWRKMLSGEPYQTHLLKAVDITRPPYTTHYPELVGFMDFDGSPRRSTVVRNLAVMCGEFVFGNYDASDNWVTGENPGFDDMANGDFALRPNAAAFDKIPGFKPIPFERMGLVQDDLRTGLPESEWHYPPPTQLAHPRPHRRAPKPPEPKTGPRPMLNAEKVTGMVSVDGALAANEWPGAPLTIAQDQAGHAAEPASQAWVKHDGDALLLAVDNPVPSGTTLSGNTWGQDAVELAFRIRDSEPIRVLRGFPDGTLRTGQTPSGPEPVSPAPMTGVVFRAKVMDKGRWTCEWRIPLSAIGWNPTLERTVQFNITVRKSAADLWLMWESTRAHSYAVDQAGSLRLAP